MKNELEIVEKIAKKAGQILIDSFGKEHDIKYKGEVDLVTEVDKASEEFICNELAKNFSGDDIFAEEGSGQRVKSGRKWIIDPLDGTVNFAHDFPFFAVSIGLEEDGELKLGVIYDPNRNEMFAAEKGKGASLNGKPIHVSTSQPLKKSLLATGFAGVAYEDKGALINLEYFGNFIRKSRTVRRPGSAATDLAWTACGRIDGFWEMHLRSWDMAAGVVLIREAGGIVTKFDGSPFDLYGTELLASNRLIHDEMMSVLKQTREK